jgi:hypothetical protein
MSNKAPLKLQNWGGAFQVEVISDPSVKQELFGWMSVFELGPQSQWRFTNSLDSKKLGVIKHAPMFLAKRPGNLRSGYLCFYPKLKVAIFVEDVEFRKDAEVQKIPRTSIIRMRHGPSIYNGGGSVFSVTLSVADSVLWIEDIIVHEGKNIWKTHSFTNRWQLLKTWFEASWTEDLYLQRGLNIRPRQPQSLDSFLPEPGSVWEFIPDEANRRRLLFKDRRLEKVTLSSYPQKPKPEQPSHTNKRKEQNKNNLSEKTNSIEEEAPTQIGILDTYFPTLHKVEGSIIALAKREPVGPDVYSLYTAENEDIGIAVIRKMMLSLAMRTHCIEKTKVKVEWNSSFDRWEITEVNVAASVSPKSAFIKN